MPINCNLMILHNICMYKKNPRLIFIKSFDIFRVKIDFKFFLFMAISNIINRHSMKIEDVPNPIEFLIYEFGFEKAPFCRRL